MWPRSARWIYGRTDEKREFLGGRAKVALLSCIEGEGEPPLELLLAAVACAGSGEVRAIPVQMMRDDSVSELDLRQRDIGVQGGMLLAHLVPVMNLVPVMGGKRKKRCRSSGSGGLMSINLSDNLLCGIWTDWNGKHGTYTVEGITAIADALRVKGGLTSLDLSSNQLCGLNRVGHGTYTAEGITAVADALHVNGALTKIE